MINSNMGCIEIAADNAKESAEGLINSNMGCIEMIMIIGAIYFLRR